MNERHRHMIWGLLAVVLVTLFFGTVYVFKDVLSFSKDEKEATDIEQRFEELKSLRDKDLITEEEYERTKQHLLDKLVYKSGEHERTEQDKPVGKSKEHGRTEQDKPIKKSGEHKNLTNITVTWEIISETPIGPKNGCPAVYDDKIYYVGGHNGDYSSYSGKRDLVVFDPYTGSWKQLAPMPYNRGESGGAVIAANDMLYVFGGGDPPGHGHRPYILQYDPAADKWTKDAAVFPYPYGGIILNAVILYNGIIYSFSGVGNTPGVNHPRQEFFTFDPRSYNLKKKGTVPHPGYWKKAFLAGDEIWLVGGHYTGDPFPIDVYDPVSDTWKASRAAPPIKGIIERIDETIFLFSPDLSVGYVYDDTKDSWLRISSHVPQLPGYISIGSIISFNGELYSKWGQNSTPNNSRYVLKGVLRKGSVPGLRLENDNEPRELFKPEDEIRKGVFSAAAVTVKGRSLTEPGKGGVVKNRDAAWDGDFSTYVEADSDGDGFNAIVWETTEVYRVPRGATNVRVHAKVEHRHWQSHAGVHAYDFEKGEYMLLIGGEKSAKGILEETVALSPCFIKNGKVRLRAVLFAKHQDRAYARYYGAEVLYTKNDGI